MNPNNPPAFPLIAYIAKPDKQGDMITIHESEGMSLRDWYKGQAIIGLLANPKFFELVGNDYQLVERARIIADIALEEREKQTKEGNEKVV